MSALDMVNGGSHNSKADLKEFADELASPNIDEDNRKDG